MKHTIKVLAVATLMAVILVASISPALARPRHFGHGLNTDKPCEVHSDTANTQHGRGAQFVDDPPDEPGLPPREGCWVVLPGHG